MFYFLNTAELSGLAAGTYNCLIVDPNDDTVWGVSPLYWDGAAEIPPPATADVQLTDEQVDEIIESLSQAISIETGGGVLHAKIADSSIHPNKYIEIIQGEQKTLTFIVQADLGMFQLADPEYIAVKIQDPEGNLIVKEFLGSSDTSDSSIEKVTTELDIQVFRVTLDAADTLELQGGVARIELTIDEQKARLTHSVKVIETLTEEEDS
jgi:hypothetical protein